jgi:hypothetical protein
MAQDKEWGACARSGISEIAEAGVVAMRQSEETRMGFCNSKPNPFRSRMSVLCRQESVGQDLTISCVFSVQGPE